MKEKVIIAGGGVSGLTAAQELIERGFDVTIYERRHWGGKIRSMGKPGTGVDGREDYPGEHGFHFFPSFYRHIPDSMKRIPLSSGKTLYESLVPGSRELILRTDAEPIEMPSHAPWLPWHWWPTIKAFQAIFSSVPLRELMFFVGRTLKFLMACEERRVAEFDKLSWWDYLEADSKSDAYRELVVRMPSLMLIAVHPRVASTRTMGNAFNDMLHAGFSTFGNIDRNLPGPPNEVWVEPWLASLQRLGVKTVMPAELVDIDFDPASNRITGMQFQFEDGPRTVEADHYLLAVPVEVASPLITDAMERAAPSLSGIGELRLGWMNGVQIFVNKPFPVINGHVAYEDSAWALTSVSQGQFWKHMELSNYGDGTMQDVFSLIISDWDTPGTEIHKKPAKACGPQEIFEEVVAQVNAALTHGGYPRLEPADILDWMIDPDISFPHPPPKADPKRLREGAPKFFKARHFKGVDDNAEPLYITTLGAWSARPAANTEIPNFYVASDFVQTTIDFASAEGANQAARKAVNAILDASASDAPRVRIWPREEYAIFAPFKAIDKHRFERGKRQLTFPFPGLGPVFT